MTRTKPARIAILSTLVVALFSTLLINVGVMPSAQAYDGNPTFRIGADDRYGYWNFLGAIRGIVNNGAQDNTVPGTRAVIDHTAGGQANPGVSGDFFSVDIHTWGGGPSDFLRVQLRRSDLYVVGWWSNDNWYNEIEPSPSFRWQNGNWRYAAGTRNAGFGPNYMDMQRVAQMDRATIQFNRTNLNDSAWTMLNAGQQPAQARARAALMYATFISEAVRFAPIGSTLGYGADQWNAELGYQLVGQENNWALISDRYNALRTRAINEHNNDVTEPGDRALHAYWRDSGGRIQEIVLWNLINFAMVLNVAKR